MKGTRARTCGNAAEGYLMFECCVLQLRCNLTEDGAVSSSMRGTVLTPGLSADKNMSLRSCQLAV